MDDYQALLSCVTSIGNGYLFITLWTVVVLLSYVTGVLGHVCIIISIWTVIKLNYHV